MVGSPKETPGEENAPEYYSNPDFDDTKDEENREKVKPVIENRDHFTTAIINA